MKTLQIHPDDNLVVALNDLKQGETFSINGKLIILHNDIPQKHKFNAVDLKEGEVLIMYGTTIGKAQTPLPAGTHITTDNTIHATQSYSSNNGCYNWEAPNIKKWETSTFLGYHRSDGRVGTRNYWLVIPLVFCENRNVATLREALEEELGYTTKNHYRHLTRQLIDLYQNGADAKAVLNAPLSAKNIAQELNRSQHRFFPNVDGIRFLIHQGGCGGTRQDAEMLCRLLAGYLNNPNVAGATVLSLGCQNAQIELLKEAIQQLNPNFKKPLYFLEQQNSTSEKSFITEALKSTFSGCMEANKLLRQPAPLSHLVLGLECGGSDGFSGISANPALGYTSDLLVALGAKAILAEFPELNGVEQELINRCTTEISAQKFIDLMHTYGQRAKEAGSDFAWNPSPGNIKDGLITDAMKSAGAARKGGTSPIVDVLDYAEPAVQPGLNLLCTPGNDVESTTGLAGSGANLIVFTTGLGTPTGNPIAPTIKFSSNSHLAKKMEDIIDMDAGSIIRGEDTLESKGVELLEFIIKVASGTILTKAEQLNQNDFIPWKRGISL